MRRSAAAGPSRRSKTEALGFISLRTKIQPSEIGEMAHFLASDAARHVTGQIIGVDGNAEWADVRHEIDYAREIQAGAVLRVTGRVTALGRSSVATAFR